MPRPAAPPRQPGLPLAKVASTAPGAHGGARKGAGRPRKPGAESHRRRPSLSPGTPLHVSFRVADHVWNLRAQRCLGPIHAAIEALRRHPRARVTHFSVQGDHVHLVVEADDRRVFSRALRALTVRVARGLNRVMGRRGTVLAARTYARPLRTPTEVRNVLRYVLGNHARHVPGAAVADPYSSAPAFDGWAALGLPAARVRYALPGVAPPVEAARSWLLRIGWQRGGQRGGGQRGGGQRGGGQRGVAGRGPVGITSAARA